MQEAFIESLPDFQLRLSEDGEIVEVLAPSLLELPAGWNSRGRIDDFLTVEDAARWRAQIHRCRATHEVHTGVQTLQVLGREVRLEVRLHALADGDGVLAFARDITAREEVLRRLEANHRLLSTIAQSFPGCLAVVERASGRALYASRSLAELLGHAPSLGALPLAEQFVHFAVSSDGPLLGERLTSLDGRGDADTVEFEARLASGEGQWRTLRVRLRVFARDPAGEVQDVFAIFEDVTEQRIAEERVRHGQKLALLGQLSGVVVHDFNNIITSVRGYAELLLESLPPGSPAADDASVIVSGIERAAGVARRLLTFSRRDVARPRAVEVGEALARMVPLLRGAVGERHPLEVRLQATGVHVWLDPVDLEQCVVNLVVNARDALAQGGVIGITLRAQERDGARLAVISVEDRGGGVDPAVRDRLFEPFFTTKAPGRGTGLGLASVLRAMRDAGGNVEVESEPGVGSTFSLIMPMYDGPEADAAPVAARAEVARVCAGVLVVEDDELVRRLLVDVLSRGGHRVRSAADAAGARAIARGQRLDLLVTDVVLPRGSGPTLARELQAQNPGMVCLFATGYYDDPELEEVPLLGARLLRKPFSPDELLDAVNALLVDRPSPW
jgi:signal transduction histidine kinase/CheY-like chemotaxis protein